MIPDFKSIEEANSLADRLIAISKERLAVGIHLIGMLIGWINDCDFDADSIEIGYVIDPVYKGQGYATEAVKAIIQYLFSIGFKKIAAAFFEANIPSKRVMEKCNMVDVGITTEVEYRGVIHKCIYYGIQTNKND